MRFNHIAGVSPLAFAKVSAGWVVTRYEAHKDEIDILAGAFKTPDEAANAARGILNAELDKALIDLQDADVGRIRE